ncbi:late embryogenesis abundant protein D-34-like [Punica granatum]|uniref:Late embryogenesis abundant protein D-34-like n=1 Tax=Punica granatum TaxID=22663 RepID=A0A218WAK9_PUNGR|nr:late embryogenesis abundant protein D-34-like [Punica granatum]OWM69825.1 hypothetical protein CDL15_Pgr025674 [Punica granatum]
MSHEQPRMPQQQQAGDQGQDQDQQMRPQEQQEEEGDQGHGQDPAIKYGDVFDVSGDLASRPVAARDAAMMQSAENTILGQTPAGGIAAVMSSVAGWNEKAGLVGHGAASDIVGREGVTVTETKVPSGRIVTEQVGGQVVGQYVQAQPEQGGDRGGSVEQSAITIGQALEAAGQTAGDKPVERSDAAAILAAEQMATGRNNTIPGGLAAAAQSAAAFNETTLRKEDKIKISQVLLGASEKLGGDRVATRQDALGIENAERWNNPKMEAQPGGVAASVAAAVRINENLKL